MRQAKIILLAMVLMVASARGQNYYEAKSDFGLKSSTVHLQEGILGRYLEQTKPNIPSFVAVFFTGVFNNWMDQFDHGWNNSRFKAWGWDPDFFYKQESFDNKCAKEPNPDIRCKPKFFGSTTFLAWTQDGWHGAKTLSYTSFEIGMLLRRNNRRGLGGFLLDLLEIKVAFIAGYYTSQLLFSDRP